MTLFRRFVFRAWLLPLLATLAGCATVFNVQPQETRGGFTVAVDLPGQPSTARVFSDIAAFAQRRGFVRQGSRPAPQFDPATHQPLPPAPERYFLGKIELDITYQAAQLRVSAYLHSFSHQLSHKFIDEFYRDFHAEYAGAYGDEGTIFETDYANDSGGPPRGGGGRGKGGRGGGQGGGGQSGGASSF